MVCEKPFVKDGMALPCGQCLPCRYRRKKVWSHRIMLEAMQHRSNAFVTLTYDDEHLPPDKSVSVRALQLFFKRLRKKGHKFRYYAVGEYGDHTLRPHYHLAMFNFPQCFRGQTDFRKLVCCETCKTVSDAWQDQGACQVAYLEPASAAYIAGYVTKKVLAKPLPKELTPEFQRMSLRPGLGLHAIIDVAAVLMQHDLEEDLEDVPHTLQHGTTHYPLGRYLRGNLRKRIGRDEKCPESVKEKVAAELRPLRESAFLASSSFAQEIVDENRGKIINIRAVARRKQGKAIL